MTQSKAEIFNEIKAVLSVAAPEDIRQLLADIAAGTFAGTAQTRAGSNDDQTNVKGISEISDTIRERSLRASGTAKVAARKSRDLREKSARVTLASQRILFGKVAS